MKAFANLKGRQIPITLDASQLPADNIVYRPLSEAKPSRHGLHAVSPLEIPEAEFSKATPDSQTMVATNLVIPPAFNNKFMATRMANPKLTTEEFIVVRLATVRESSRHCYWPSDVVARFAAADVIR